MGTLILCALIFPLQVAYAKSALDHFLAHKRIFNCSITVLNYGENNDKIWVQYVYNFQKDERILDKTLRIATSSCETPNKFESEHALITELLANLIDIKFQMVALNCENADIIVDANVRNISSNYVKSLPIFESHYVAIYAKNFAKYEEDIFVITFVGSLWLCFLVLLVFLAIFLRVSTNRYATMHESCSKWPWSDISLWAIAAACQQGLSATPTRFASCFIFLLGYFAAYLLYTGFAAGITSVLLGQNSGSRLTKGQLEGNLIAFPYYYHDKVRIAASMDELVRTVQLQKAVGIVPKWHLQRYLRQTSASINWHNYASNYEASLLVLNEGGLVKELNKRILRFKETGTLWRRTIDENPSARLQETSSYSRVGFEHVGSAILLLISGALLAIFFLICEFLYAYYEWIKSRRN